MLLDPRTLREIAAELGLRPTKTRGQNFVHDANTVRRIVAAAGLTGEETVLEVGPGLGSLTLALLETGAQVIAVEIEPALARRLPQTVREMAPEQQDQLTVLETDALQLLAEQLAVMPDTLVANLPYNVSVPVILRLLARFATLARGLVMVQSEVADRLVAQPGTKSYGIPSAKLAWYGQAERIGSVPPSVFWPVPKVDSGLVRFVRQPAPGSDAERQLTFAVIDAAFAQRRKMLRSALAGLFGTSAAAVQGLESAGIDPQARGEVLSVQDFQRIAQALDKQQTRE